MRNEGTIMGADVDVSLLYCCLEAYSFVLFIASIIDTDFLYQYCNVITTLRLQAGFNCYLYNFGLATLSEQVP